MSKITQRASFDFIRYANVWEDADILLEGLQCKPNNRILSIASAGDNSFSLLTTSPELVVAVDVNPVQLWLTELKRVAIQHLSQEECIAFLGFAESNSRKETFALLKSHLSTDALVYFEEKLDDIVSGIVHKGKFERYFQLFSKRILPFIHSKKTINKLLAVKSGAEQILFYDKQWNTWRWRLLFKIFFSKWVMGKLGRDPEFLAEVKVPVSQFIFLKAEKHLKSIHAQHNHILRYNLTGSFDNELPHYLRVENFQGVKANLHKLILFQGYAEEAIKQHGPFDAMNMSNIFEYMPQDIFKQTAIGLETGLKRGGRIAYWNLMVPRRLNAICNTLQYEKSMSDTLTEVDKGFFYHSIIIEEKRWATTS